MQTVVIDLAKDQAIKDAFADVEPGDPVCLYGTIKSKDDQTAIVTVTECEPDDRDEDEKEEGEPPTKSYGPDNTTPAPSGGDLLGEDAAV